MLSIKSPFKSKSIWGILTGVGTVIYQGVITGGVTATTIGTAVTVLLVGLGMRDAVAKNGNGQ